MKSVSGIEHAYTIFCDTHNLKRIDATAQEEADNLQLLIMVANLRLNQIQVEDSLSKGTSRRSKR